MTSVPEEPIAAPSITDLLHRLDEAHTRWESAERARSNLTVFSIVMAGVALVASVVAWGFAATRSPAMAMPAAAPTATRPAVFASVNVPVSLSEFKVTLPSGRLTAGTKTLQITNAGTMQHELLVFHPSPGIDPNNLPLDKDGNVVEDAPGVNKISDGDNLDPGATQSRTVDLTQPGTYVFVCNLPGHYRLGMHTVVTVVAP